MYQPTMNYHEACQNPEEQKHLKQELWKKLKNCLLYD